MLFLLLLLVCTTVAGERAGAGLVEPLLEHILANDLPSHFGRSAAIYVCRRARSQFRGGLEEIARVFQADRAGWIVTGCLDPAYCNTKVAVMKDCELDCVFGR